MEKQQLEEELNKVEGIKGLEEIKDKAQFLKFDDYEDFIKKVNEKILKIKIENKNIQDDVENQISKIGEIGGTSEELNKRIKPVEEEINQTILEAKTKIKENGSWERPDRPNQNTFWSIRYNFENDEPVSLTQEEKNNIATGTFLEELKTSWNVRFTNLSFYVKKMKEMGMEPNKDTVKNVVEQTIKEVIEDNLKNVNNENKYIKDINKNISEILKEAIDYAEIDPSTDWLEKYSS